MRFAGTLEVIAVKSAETWRLVRKFFRHVPSLGFLAAAAVFFCEASARKPLSHLVKPLSVERVKVRPSGYSHPIRFRRVGTDVKVLQQMLVSREYQPVASLRNVRLIIDCGANIGLSAYYLLHWHPKARLIAIEPDAENCGLCRQNLQPFGDRAVVLQAAVWPENTRLRIVPASRTGGAWSLKVEPWPSGDIEGLTIPEILHRADATGPIDLLKVDIEGAETELFRGAPAWLGMTRNIAIELHNDVADRTFSRALEGHRYERRRVSEVTTIYGLRPISS